MVGTSVYTLTYHSITLPPIPLTLCPKLCPLPPQHSPPHPYNTPYPWHPCGYVYTHLSLWQPAVCRDLVSISDQCLDRGPPQPLWSDDQCSLQSKVGLLPHSILKFGIIVYISSFLLSWKSFFLAIEEEKFCIIFVSIKKLAKGIDYTAPLCPVWQSGTIS